MDAFNDVVVLGKVEVETMGTIDGDFSDPVGASGCDNNTRNTVC